MLALLTMFVLRICQSVGFLVCLGVFASEDWIEVSQEPVVLLLLTLEGVRFIMEADLQQK